MADAPPDALPSILVVEDDADLADLLRLHLGAAGYAVEHVSDGALALQRALGGAYDALVLDVMLPGMTGTEVCRELRAAGRTVPVLMLTALGAEADRVAGLDGGADDYVVKPFSVREVLARVGRALAARRDGAAPARRRRDAGRRRPARAPVRPQRDARARPHRPHD